VEELESLGSSSWGSRVELGLEDWLKVFIRKSDPKILLLTASLDLDCPLTKEPYVKGLVARTVLMGRGRTFERWVLVRGQ
jgi:hypothetical protein